MLIDSCASGGRRDDLESMRRAVPFLRSDYCTDPEGMQCHTYAFGMWLPYYRGATETVDTYDWRSNLSPLMMPAWDMRKKLDYEKIRKSVAEWRRVAPLMFGDYYPLTPYSLASDSWMGFQFDLPESGEGMVQAFRRAGAPVEGMRFKLKGLNADAIYAVRDFDKTGSEKVSGRELMETGLLVKIPPRGSAVILYSKQ
jgi:alpha-galactosidase